MKHYQHRPRKRFGQNFLTDEQVIHSLVEVISPETDDNMIEIGPGLGAMTFSLLPKLKQLTVIELDRDLASQLRGQFSEKLKVIEEDALNVDLNRFVTSGCLLRIVGNLPYNISTPLIFHFLSMVSLIADMHFMLQKEVVDRLAAKPGSKTYGRLSVMVQYFCEVEKLIDIRPDAFYPPPKVQSAFVRLKPYVVKPFVANDFQHFANIVKQAFSQRRKTLRNNLPQFTAEQFEKVGIDPKTRAEQLTVEEYVKLASINLS